MYSRLNDFGTDIWLAIYKLVTGKLPVKIVQPQLQDGSGSFIEDKGTRDLLIDSLIIEENNAVNKLLIDGDIIPLLKYLKGGERFKFARSLNSTAQSIGKRIVFDDDIYFYVRIDDKSIEKLHDQENKIKRNHTRIAEHFILRHLSKYGYCNYGGNVGKQDREELARITKLLGA